MYIYLLFIIYYLFYYFQYGRDMQRHINSIERINSTDAFTALNVFLLLLTEKYRKLQTLLNGFGR